jgi:hypothetical protein
VVAEWCDNWAFFFSLYFVTTPTFTMGPWRMGILIDGIRASVSNPRDDVGLHFHLFALEVV